jgi:lysophospholipase L1-like esterase/poly(3-hydroxybutyrate) depolymerase
MKFSPAFLSMVLFAMPTLAQDLTNDPVNRADQALVTTSPVTQEPAKPIDLYEARTFTGADGGVLNYRLLKPQNYDATKKYPLVLFLHGAGERGSNNVAQLKHGAPLFVKPEVREKYPCIVVVPQCPTEQKWADIDWASDNPVQAEKPSPSMTLVLGLLDALPKEFSIDADRLYVTGISMGGYGTWDLITRLPEKWAAAVPICGGGDKAAAAKAKGLPIWAFHGTDDRAVKLIRTVEMIEAIKAAGGDPLFSEYPNVAHDSWTAAYSEPELLPWLFAQKRAQAPVPFAKAARPWAQPPSNQFAGDGPIQAGLWFRPLWADRRAKWSEEAANLQGAVVFFGDSITQGWNTLAKDFPNLKVANRGISGDTTRGLRGRLQDVLDLHPKAVSMLIGTNDLSLGATPDIVVANVKAIVEELHKADPKMPIILNKVMPRGPQPGKFPEKIVKLNALYEQAFGTDPQVTICDTWSLFDDGNSQSKKEEFPDMLHPNAAGYAKWTAALRPIFEKLKLAQ